MFLVSAFLAAAASLAGQDPKPAELPVRVPTFPNSTCPIMGKKASLSLPVDTELGRIYVCCKPCVRKVQTDVPTAHRTAYPAPQRVANATCPVTGEAIGAGALQVTLQGKQFAVCCAGCVPVARRHSQVTLLRLAEPSLQDIANETCPVTGQPVAANAMVVVGDSIVRLAAENLLAAVEKVPAQVLAKARAIAAAQRKPARHEHIVKPEVAAQEPSAEGGR